ncbi:oligosaccharyl transferase STT3 subunit [Methanocaldococcus villosus KIN24-T80]|uniref:dolichyl-phosphooligosaccharide-protein glycotransferase n=1 Tax=Methanocaldococcus villosus KIN24-T80 TaxID=1069083 RepID=N6VZ22_9EURY|nr:STT3 domain-containing protein [Methanocaldococcus villosus]ENN96377.1 oligosaccharyl transferase STT3 subunit [Methanocaldococcus villosus KIN24-T80]
MIENISKFFNEKSWIKVLFILIVLMLLSFQLRAQTADMKFAGDNEFLKKLFSDEHGRMYLLALDPYYYLRLTENLYNHGHCGETLKEINGKLLPYDTCQYAPPGHPVSWEPPIICLTNLALYYIWHSIDNTVSIMNAAFWVPAVLSMLLPIPIFFIIRRVTNSYIGSAVGAIALITAPSLLYKTCAGFADTPIFEVLPILYIVWFILEALHYQDKTEIFNRNFKNIFSLFVIVSLIVEAILGAYLNISEGEITVFATEIFYMLSFMLLLFGIVIIIIKKIRNETIPFEIFLTLAIITTALAPKMWGGWWYGFDVIMIFFIIYLIAIKIFERYDFRFILTGNFKNVLYMTAFYIFGSLILLGIIYGANMILSPFLSPVGYQQVLSTYQLSTGWPNVYTTVAELEKPESWEEIFTASVGSPLLAIFGILGIIFSFISLRYGSLKIDIKYSLLLSLWLVVTLYASTKGIRFASLSTPPLVIGFGIFVGQLIRVLERKDILILYTLGSLSIIIGIIGIIKNYNKIYEIVVPSLYVPIAEYTLLIGLLVLFIYKLSDIYNSIRENRELIYKIASILLCLGIVIPQLSAVIPFSEPPTFNNGWKESLDWIKNNTPENAVITCWWDNGHIYTWATRKMVTFDGGSQNSPRAYWVGRAFATSNEELAVGILRMLATSGDEAFKKGSVLMNKTHNNVSKTVEILNEILPLNRSAAYKILTEKYGLTDKEAKEVLNATHPEHPNPDYLITYNRMTDIASVWSMFGFWNFSLPPNTSNDVREKGWFLKLRAKGIKINNSLDIVVILKKTVKYSIANIIEIKGENISTNNVLVDSTGRILKIEKPLIHRLIIYDKNNKKYYNKVINESANTSLIVRIDNNMVYAWLSSKNLEDSIYAKLHFLDGYGLKHIKLVKASIDPTSYGVQPGFKVYKVDYGNYLN